MAIDKIVLEFQAETTKLKKELEDLKSRLGNVETAAKDAGKKTGKAFDDVGKNANGLKDTIKNLGQQIAAAFAAREIIRFTKQTIDAASDLNETVSKSEQIFGTASKSVEQFASNSAKQFGQSKQQAIDAAASFGVFGKAAGLTGEDLSTFSTDLVALSADLASFGNTTPEEAALALGAALRGEAEPIRRFGVLLDDATLKQEALAMGLIKTTKGALTPQQKVLAANAVILKQTADAQGDFARTSDGVANQQRILEASFKDLQTEIGQKLLPTFNSALKSLNEILENLDADTVMSFAKAAGAAALAFGGWKLGPLVSMLPQVAKGIMTMNTATLALNKTLKTNLFTAAFAFALPYIIDFIDGVDEAGEEVDQLSERQEELKSVTESLVEAETEQLGVANNYFSALSKTNPKSKERKELIDEINKRYGTTLKNLSDEVAFQNQLKEAQDKVVEGIKEKIALQIQEEKYTTLLKQRAKFAGQATQEEAKLNALEKKFLEEKGMTVAQYNQSLVEQRLNELSLSETEREIAEQRRRAITTGDELLVQIEKQAKAYDVAQNEVAKIDSEINILDADTKNLVNSMSSLTTTTNNNTTGNEKAKTAIEKLNEELANLKTAQENATFEGDIETAKKYQEAISKLENQLAIFKSTLESIRGGVVSDADLENIDKASDLSFEYLDNLAKGFGLLDNAKPDFTTDEDGPDIQPIISGQEKAQEKVRETQELFNNIANSVTSVTGPAFSAINALYDANLQRLENEKNKRLANENLTAEERLRIEEEYEKKKNEMMAEQFEVGRAEQIITATMSAAQAALNAYASTAAIPLVGPGLATAAAAIAAGFGALQIGVIAAQPNPYKFYDGTPYLQLGDNPKGRDTIPVMAHEGEAIIPTRNNLQYPGLAKSWIEGDLDRYINNNFVRPALMEQQKQAEEEFADRLAASMALQMAANFDDYRLHRDLKEQTAVLRDGFHSMKTTRKKLRGA